MKSLFVAQSGGPTAVINSSLAGVVDYALKSGKFEKVLGCVYGVEGVLEENFVSMDKFKDENKIRLLKQTPSSYLGSCRKKLSDDDKVFEKIFEVFEKNNIGAFVYIGGNDSMDTVDKLSRYATKKSINTAIIGVPKTIDNDLALTDHTPGYGSAAKYIINSLRQLAMDTDVYDMNSVIVAEIMGRNAGWLTAAAALANDDIISPVDIICLPEVPFFENKFIEKMSKLLNHKKTMVIAVSEGICDSKGNYIAAGNSNRDENDGFNHAALGGAGKYVEELIKKHFGIKTRLIEFSTIQRCSAETASLTDVNESFMQGEYGAKLAIEGAKGVMVGIVREPGNEYSTKLTTFDISKIANKEKKIPESMLGNDGFSVSDEFIKYAAPLVVGHPEIVYNNGIIQFETR